MVTNYFKVCHLGRPQYVQVFPFEEQSRDSVEAAWQGALLARDAPPRSGELPRARKVVVWRKIAIEGPWTGVPITFLSGLHENFIREYAREYA